MIGLIERAQNLRAPSQRLADAFGTRYTLFVLACCAILFGWSWRGRGCRFFWAVGKSERLLPGDDVACRDVAVCAGDFGAGGDISAIAFGARHGVLFRAGSAIERLAAINVVALDKTGTLTEGNLGIDEIEVFHGSEDDLLAVAGAMARISTHPMSRAIASAADAADCRRPAVVRQSRNVPGNGLRGVVNGRAVLLGNREMMLDPTTGSLFAVPPPPPENVNETWVSETGCSDGCCCAMPFGPRPGSC